MKYRYLGNTDLQISEIGFGCGPMAGLMVRGDRRERNQAVARALDLGITYFDTASVYGDGLSETHLGETLKDLGVRPVVGTKVALQDEDLGNIPESVIRSVDSSLQRLGMDSIDILHLHNRVAITRAPGASVAIGTLLTVEEVLGPGGVLEGFRQLQSQGKTRFLGCCAFGGEVPAINKLIDSDSFQSMLTYYNILNPTAEELPHPSFQGIDYGQVMGRATAHGMGAIVLRVVAGGALSGVQGRSALAGAIRGTEWEEDLIRAQSLRFLTEIDGGNLAQAAIRYGLMRPEANTVLVGFSDLNQIEEAAPCSEMPRFSAEALTRIRELRRTDFGLKPAS